MENYEGTRWQRKTDGLAIKIEGDADRGGSSSRYLLARNLETGRTFWISPKGLARKYVRYVRSYGACPTQLDGRGTDGRPFYFRARHGVWQLRVGAVSDPTEFTEWADWGTVVAEGEDPTAGFMPADDVDALITEHLGEGWGKRW